MCVSSSSNIVFPCKICNININNKDSVIQCDSQFWIDIKCNKLNHIDYNCLEGSNDRFGTLANKKFLFLANSPHHTKLSNKNNKL